MCALISKTHTFSSGSTIIASEHNTNFDVIYSCVNGSISNANISNIAAIAYSKLNLTGLIVNADIGASAAIAPTKLAQITTASKVHGSAITGLASVVSGAGVLPVANLGSGTPSSANFLRGDGAFAAIPTPGVPVILRWGSIDAVTVNTCGLTLNASLTAAAPTVDDGTGYIFWSFTQNSVVNVLQSEPVLWKKTAGITTVSGTFFLWEQSGGAGSRQVSAYVDIGGQVSSTLTAASATPTSKSWSVDVSSLTTGTSYEIKIMCKDDVGGGNETTGYVAKIIGYES